MCAVSGPLHSGIIPRAHSSTHGGLVLGLQRCISLKEEGNDVSVAFVCCVVKWSPETSIPTYTTGEDTMTQYDIVATYVFECSFENLLCGYV